MHKRMDPVQEATEAEQGNASIAGPPNGKGLHIHRLCTLEECMYDYNEDEGGTFSPGAEK